MTLMKRWSSLQLEQNQHEKQQPTIGLLFLINIRFHSNSQEV